MFRYIKDTRYTALILLIGCFVFLMCTKDMPTISKNKTSNIVLNITINQILQRITPQLEKKTVITQVTVTVTASDMETITKNLTGSDDTYSGVIEVPQGSRRTFSIEAKDAKNIVQYKGSTSKDLKASTETIDITLDPQYPNAVTLNAGTVTGNSITLNWTESTDADFNFYRITRKETSGSHDVNNDKLVDITTSKSTTSYTDTGLQSLKTYYYKVWVVDTEMLAKSSNEVNATTISSEPNLDRYLGTGSVLNYSYNSTTHVLSYDWSVENNGSGAAGSFRIGIYLSDNTTITSLDHFIAYEIVSNLAAGAYVNVSGTKNLWDFDCSTLPSDTYYVGVIIDYQDDITESDETDNEYYFTTSFSYTCPAGQANLTRYEGSGAIRGYSYDNTTHVLTLNYSVLNNGTANAGSFKVGWFLSTNTSITTSDVFLVSWSQVLLSSGYYVNTNNTKDLDDISCSTLPSGYYYVGVMIDYEKNVSESDETDNDYYFTSQIYWDGCGALSNEKQAVDSLPYSGSLSNSLITTDRISQMNDNNKYTPDLNKQPEQIICKKTRPSDNISSETGINVSID
ncbi:fibronectin type III domain-containing protein [candidate division KSB1 bacterium]|nr:fibronectin type III domain-containing protein [candidate division KSB1 bacterium]